MADSVVCTVVVGNFKISENLGYHTLNPHVGTALGGRPFGHFISRTMCKVGKESSFSVVRAGPIPTPKESQFQ